MKWHQVHPGCLQSHQEDLKFWCACEALGVLPPVVEETEKSVQVHIGRPFQEELLQRVSYLNQLTLPSYDGGCLAVIDKLSVSSV